MVNIFSSIRNLISRRQQQQIEFARRGLPILKAVATGQPLPSTQRALREKKVVSLVTPIGPAGGAFGMAGRGILGGGRKVYSLAKTAFAAPQKGFVASAAGRGAGALLAFEGFRFGQAAGKRETPSLIPSKSELYSAAGFALNPISTLAGLGVGALQRSGKSAYDVVQLARDKVTPTINQDIAALQTYSDREIAQLREAFAELKDIEYPSIPGMSISTPAPTLGGFSFSAGGGGLPPELALLLAALLGGGAFILGRKTAKKKKRKKKKVKKRRA